jgi:putative transposase
MVESGAHLLRCLCYVDLNMVRTGKVGHPREWRWCGYDELTGRRARYRILDVERLTERLGLNGVDELALLHARGVEEQIQRRELAREGHWTESLAVGSEAFVASVEALYTRRRQFVRSQVSVEGAESRWAVKETPASYGADSDAKSRF